MRAAPDAADELPWEWPFYRGARGDLALWRPGTDPAGHELLVDYGRTLRLWYTDEELAGDEYEMLDRSGELAEYLQAGLPPVVRRMYDDGEIARIFGRPIPITFSSHETHQPAWEWARAANPPELYAVFGTFLERNW